MIKLGLYTNADVYGGLAQQVHLLASGLKQSGDFDITVITVNSTQLALLSNLLAEDRIRHHHLKIINKFDLKGLVHAIRYFRKQRFDLIHIHLSNIYSPTLIYLAAFLSGTPGVVTTPHSLFPIEHLGRLRLFLQRRYLSLFNSKIIAVCRANEEILRNEFSFSPLKITLIKNGIDTNLNGSLKESTDFTLRREYDLDNATKLVGTVGTVNRLKGMDYFIKAYQPVASQVQNVTFFIVGAGPDLLSLERLSEKLGIANRIIFTGFRKDVQAILSQFDVFVLPSLTESLPNIILEALALQIPVVATDVGGTGEVIENKKTGILVPPRRSDDLAEAIISLLKAPKYARILASNGHNMLAKEHSSELMIRKTAQLYGEVLNTDNGINRW